MLGSICREAMKRILFLMYEFEGGIMLVLLTSSLEKHVFYNYLMNNILYLCVT